MVSMLGMKKHFLWITDENCTLAKEPQTKKGSA